MTPRLYVLFLALTENFYYLEEMMGEPFVRPPDQVTSSGHEWQLDLGFRKSSYQVTMSCTQALGIKFHCCK